MLLVWEGPGRARTARRQHACTSTTSHLPQPLHAAPPRLTENGADEPPVGAARAKAKAWKPQ